VNGHQGHGAGLLGKGPQDQQEGQDQPQALHAVAVARQRVTTAGEGGGGPSRRLLPPPEAAGAPDRAPASVAAESDNTDQASTWQFTPGEKIAPGLFAWAALGVGRRHETWLAWNLPRWSPVVAKMPRKDSLTGSARRGLAREAAIAEALSHPSIVRLLDARVGQDEAVPYIMYEYLEGPALEAVIGDEGPLTPPDVVRLGMQVAGALHYLHGRHVVHLDIKPGNIAIRDGRAILMDFDIALPTGAVRSRIQPSGTPCYMAPEQVRCLPAAPSMDLWALGAVLYEAATGQLAFDVGGEGSDRTYPQLTQPPRPLRAHNPSISTALENLVTALLQRDPPRRPPTAMAALQVLAASLPAGEEGLWPAWADRLLPQRNQGRDPTVRGPADPQAGSQCPELATAPKPLGEIGCDFQAVDPPDVIGR
jgi:serine/threonine protein kinase